MKSKKLFMLGRLAVAQVLLAVVLGGFAWAQEFRGTISGTLTDPSGAVIPGAVVLVREFPSCCPAITP
jgi:hypothetical protein